PVPLPRKPDADLLRLPLRLVRAVRGAREVLRRTGADVIVGFGGYACVPMYLAGAATRGRVPIVVHEANARAGLANKLGDRFAVATLAAVHGSGLDARVVGNPVRRTVSSLDRADLRAHARAEFGLDPDAPTVLVVGGSQGARSLNAAMSEVAGEFSRAGVGVLHAVGPKNIDTAPRVGPGGVPYVAVPYLDRMDLAYAAADLVLCRSGAITVAEVSAVGLPAVFVPLPHGNGEQALNARDLVAGGAALLVDDRDLTADHLRSEGLPLVLAPGRPAPMSADVRPGRGRGSCRRPPPTPPGRPGVGGVRRAPGHRPHPAAPCPHDRDRRRGHVRRRAYSAGSRCGGLGERRPRLRRAAVALRARGRGARGA